MPSPPVAHPFQNTTSKLVVLREQHIDVEEEARVYDQICEGIEGSTHEPAPEPERPRSEPPSIFSRESESIWLADHRGESPAFAQDVAIAGWTSVGDRRGGAYVVYDCVIKSKEGPVIHAHKRYTSFLELYSTLHHTLPRDLRRHIPTLPPKAPLAKLRPAFLEIRRRALERWLAQVLLHPEIGASLAVRRWVVS